MSISIRIIPAANAEWDDWLGPAHDYYHSAAYHRFAEQQGEGQAFLAVYGSRERFLAWPYLLRPVDTCEGLDGRTGFDVTSVYGYPGPIWPDGPPDGDFCGRALHELAAVWQQQGVVCAFTRFHPLLDNCAYMKFAPPVPAGIDARGIVEGSPTVSIDLSASHEENLQDYQRILRQEINAARRSGLVTELDEHWSNLNAFARLYHRTMERNRAASYYFFSTDYLRGLKQALGAHGRLMVTRLGDQLAAACVFLAYGGAVHAHLEGTNESLLRFSPFKLLIDDTRIWARGQSYRTLHLGGGRGGQQDSLFAFKARFSRRRHRFFTGRWVLDPPSYESLVEQRQRYAAAMGRVLRTDTSFPAYRAPTVRPEPQYGEPPIHAGVAG